MKPTSIAQSRLIPVGMLVLAGFYSAAPAAAPRVNDPADIKAIQALEHDIATETKLSGFIGHYGPDAVLVDVWSPEPFIGREAIGKNFGGQLTQVQSIKTQLLDEDILSDGTLACVATHIHVAFTMKDGKVAESITRQLDGLRKVNGTWLIQQQHISLPIDAKTQMAVINGPQRSRGAIDWGANPLAGPATGAAEGKAGARKWVEEMAPVVDIDELLPFYGPGEAVQIYDIFYPGTLRGRKEVHDAYAPLFATLKGATMKMPYFTADSDGLLAFQLDKQDVVLRLKDGGTQNISFRESDCLRHVDGKWLSFFAHLSFPVDIATHKALVAKQ